MVTAIGKYLRKIRIDSDEILYNMAEKLEVTSSFLSAVECGKKKMPKTWEDKIIKLYNLSTKQINDFDKAIAETENSVSIDLDGLSNTSKDFAISFARTLNGLSDEQINQIKQIIMEDSRNK